MSTKILFRQSLIGVVLVFMLAGCSATLAPSYDKALVEGLTKANTTVMELLASEAGGVQKDTFSQREEKYAAIIGTFDALAIQTKARPVPKNKVIDKIDELLAKRNVEIIDHSETCSATAMTKISETLSKMKETDRKQGLTGMEVQLFKQQIAIYLDQALTYESFLER